MRSIFGYRHAMYQLEVTVRGCGAYRDTIIQYLLSSFKVGLRALKVGSFQETDPLTASRLRH
uniref:Uncharacterized protein n=1 Tax=Zea mays TaxID=4577 RepID=C4IYI0_MAIZE|nr:unknown [Zea mays]ACR35543.1 unknown [Zea mays]